MQQVLTMAKAVRNIDTTGAIPALTTLLVTWVQQNSSAGISKTVLQSQGNGGCGSSAKCANDLILLGISLGLGAELV